MPDLTTVNPNQPVPTGLINQAPGSITATPGAPPPGATPGAPVTSYTPAQAQAKTYTPEDRTVGQNETVAGQIKGLLDAGSPLLEQAETNARQQMNARGLINSTQAISAGQQALYAAALPIASADAQTYKSAGDMTTTARNQAAQINAGLETQVDTFNTTQQNTQLGQAAQAANQQSLTGQQIAGQTGLQLIQSETQKQIAQLQADTSLTAQDKATASAQIIARLQADTSLTAQDKQNATQQAIAQLQSSTQMTLADKSAASSKLIADLQASTQLTLADKSALTQTTLAGMQDQTQKYVANLQSNTQLTAQERAIEGNKALAEMNNLAQAAIQRVQSDTSLSIAQQQAETNKIVTSMNNENARKLQDMVNAGNLANIAANGEINTAITKLQNDNKILLQTSAGAKDLYSQVLKNLSDIQNNNDMDWPVKQDAMSNNLKHLQDSLNILNTMSKVPGLSTGLEYFY